jgi:hypothetical protein
MAEHAGWEPFRFLFTLILRAKILRTFIAKNRIWLKHDLCLCHL